MNQRLFAYSQKLNDCLAVIESSQSVAQRQHAVHAIAHSRDPEAGRLLIDLYTQIPWRETKKLVIAALAHFPTSKSLEFLIGLASHDTDLDIAAAALNALGSANAPQAGQFLLAFVKNNKFSLKKEAITALCYTIDMPLAAELAALITHLGEEGFTGTLPHVLLACSKHGYRQAWPAVESKLHAVPAQAEATAYACYVMAAAYYGETATLAGLREGEFAANPWGQQLLMMGAEFSNLVSVQSIEDLVLRFDLHNTDHYATVIRNLSRFTKTDVWNFLVLMKQEGKASADLDCLVHAHFFTGPDTLDACHELLVQGQQQIALPYQAYLLRSLLKVDPQGIARIKQQLPLPHFLQLCELVVIEAPLVHLGHVLQAEHSDADKIAAINALTWQCLMRTSKDALLAEVGRFLFSQLPQHNVAIASRMIRGLGQIHFTSKPLTAFLQKELAQGSPLASSIYRYIKQLGKEELSVLLLDKLAELAQSPSAADPLHSRELGSVLAALTGFDTLSGAERLALLSEQQRTTHRSLLILLLGRHRLEGFSDFIGACLDEPAFQIRIAAIAAVKMNGTPPLYHKLTTLLSHQDVSLRDHAAYTLSTAGEIFQHKTLNILQKTPDARSALLTFLKNFEMAPASNYTALTEVLRTALATEKAPFHDEAVLEAGHNLVDNLLLVLAEAAQHPSADNPGSAASHKHSIDQAIRQDLPKLGEFSETIKSMIRNAELTLRNPNLFNSTVDKSTVVIEYVKSIDLLLQEKVGAQIFGRNREKVLAGMRSRVIALAIDDQYTNVAQLIKNLRCQNQFNSNNFPFAKLASLSQAVINGKIMAHPYKTVDGLRAWAIMLILFARPLKIDTHAFDPLVVLGNLGVSATTDLSYRLNALQEIRNQAAHHGTMLDYDKLIEIRNGCFEVLISLTAATS